MPLLFGYDKAVADWVARENRTAFAEPYTGIGILDDAGHLTGGLVFWCFSGKSINIAMVGATCLRRGVFRAVIAYVFGQLGCDRLEVKPSTRHLRRVASRVGLRYEGTARSFYGVGINAHVYSLTREDLPAFTARWALNGNRQLSSSRSRSPEDGESSVGDESRYCDHPIRTGGDEPGHAVG